jgi:uncharacterized membrane protein YesL
MSNNKKFKLFDMNRDGPGVSKDEKPFVPNIISMPGFYCRNFTRLLSLNFLMLPMLLIPLALVYMFIIAPTTPSETSLLYSTLYGSHVLGESPVWNSLMSVYGIQLNLPTFSPGVIWVMLGLGALLAAIWGWINVGATYCTRNMLKGDPVFLTSDFFYAIKRNFWSGLLLGLIDFGILAILIFDFAYFSKIGGTFMIDFFYYAICALCIIYFFMRFYIYLMLVTFDIKIKKIFKNALIFSVLGVGRNLMSFLGIIILLALNVALILLLWPLGVVAPLILPLIYLLPSINLLITYGAYPVIEKYMINND